MNYNVRDNIFLSLNKIKNWNTNISYFLKAEILDSSILINKSRLKTLFLETIKDYLIWNEIDKMITKNCLYFSASSLFPSLNSFCRINLLSYLLFDLYLLELDNYVFELCSFFSYNFLVYKRYFYEKLSSNRSFSCVLPVKATKELYVIRRASPFYVSYNSFNRSFCFQKNLYYTRYRNYFLFGVVGSEFFSFKLKNRILSYVRGNLNLEFVNFSLISSSDSSFCFCGYMLLLTKFSVSNITSKILTKGDFLKNRIFRRLNCSKLNFSKLLLSRTYHEFSLYIKSLINSRYSRFLSNVDSLVCLKLFLLGAVDIFIPVTLNLFRQNRCLSYTKSDNYFFNIFLFNMKEVNTYFDRLDTITNKLYLPIDLSFKSLLKEFNTRFSFLYLTLFDLTKARNTFLRSYFLNDCYSYSGLLFSDFDIFFSLCLFTDPKIFDMKSRFTFNFSIPISRIVAKFRLLGFFHPLLDRPIGNIGLINLEDSNIIFFFSYFLNSFLIWYKKAFDYYKVSYILFILKKSCLLTLSRKHRKSRSWSYILYASFFYRTLSYRDLYSLNSGSLCLFNEFFLFI